MMTPHVAAAVAAQSGVPAMRLGLNLSGISSWANAWPFNNLMYNANYPEVTSGAGAFTYDQGYISATDSNSVRRLKFADNQSKLPPGDYTVLNPAGDLIAIGDFGEPVAGNFTTSTQFTFNIPVGTANTMAKSLFVKGNLTGNVAIIMPGCLSLWQAGNIWNPQFLTFLQGAKPKILRTMDWNIASDNIESEWAHRTVPGKPCLRNAATKYFGGCVPYEFMFDLAGRVGCDLWINVPHRASSDYVTKLGQLINTNMPTGRKAWIEPVGNEVWNYGAPWSVGTIWVEFSTYTRRTASIDVENNRYILAGHGLTNGTQIYCFATLENRTALTSRDYRLDMGGVYVKAIDANTFEAYAESSLTTKLSVGTNAQNLLFVVDGESGKTRDLNGGYSAKALDVFNVLDSVAPGKIVRLIASQIANTSTASGRWAYSNVASRADYLAGAPYFSGSWFGTSITPTDGQLAVGFWCNNSATLTVGVYASGSTPTIADIKAGTGAIATQTYNYTSGSSSYTTAATFAGLTTGTSYSVHVVVTSGGITDKLSGTATASAGSTTYLTLPYSRQALRNKLSTHSNRTLIASNQAVSSPKKLVYYECGLHFHETPPADLNTWMEGYLSSPEMQSCVRGHLQDAANQRVAAALYFSDVSTTRFRLADAYDDTSDLKYQAFASFNGSVKKASMLTATDILASNIPSKPGVLPAVVCALPVAPVVCEVVDGDDGNNFAISGTNLVMANDIGINWSQPVVRSVRLVAKNGDILAPFYVNFSTGLAWYEADSKFVWSSISDTDSAEINPIIGGGALALKAATPATISGGVWDMDNACYSSASSMVSTVPGNSPYLVAAVLDKDNIGTASYVVVFQVGGSPYIQYSTSSGADSNFKANVYVNGGTVGVKFKATGTIPTGSHVYWVYGDGTGNITAGIDQSAGETSYRDPGTSVFSTDMYVGSSNNNTPVSKMKHGSIQVLSRTGMTLTDAKAIVAKMQALHGIA